MRRNRNVTEGEAWESEGGTDPFACPTRLPRRMCRCQPRCIVCGYGEHDGVHQSGHGQPVGSKPWGHRFEVKHERTIARLAKAGMTTATIADVLEVRPEYVAEVLRRNPASERAAAIAELKAEGYSDERIRAVFGE